jgi:DNA-binding MarR family transcriptional regulator
LRTPEVSALLMLGRTGRTTIKPLVLELRLTSGAVTALLDRMESVDLVRREGNPDDRRSVLVSLTANGERIRAELVERFVDNVAHAIELQPDLGDSRLPDQLDRATQALRTISVDEPHPAAAPRE